MANGDALIRRGSTSKVAAPAYSPRVNVSGMALAAAMGSVTLLSGSGVAPSGQSATVSMGTVAVTASSNVAPTGQSATTDQGTISFTIGADVLVRVGSAAAITAPAFTSGAAHTPTGQYVTVSQGTVTPSVINGANPVGMQMVATASGAGCDIDATVGVDGIAMTASQGTANAAGVTGDHVEFPAGQSVTAGQGTVSLAVAPTPTGQSLTASQGTVVPVASAAPSPSGQSVTVSLGTPLIQVGSEQTDATVPTTGFGLAVGFNDTDTTWPIEHTATGYGLTVGFGTAAVSVDDSEAVSGYGLTTSLGFAVPVADATVAVSGYGLTVSRGTPDTSGNITIRPTGFLLVTGRGTPTMGGTDLNRPLVITDRSGPRYGVRWAAGPRYEMETRAHPRYWAEEVRMATNDKVYFNNDDEPEYYITRRNTSTGEVEPAAGLANVICYLSALPMPNHTAIHANLSISLTERASAPGYYYGVMQGSDLATHLATYANKAVYRILDIGSDVEGQERVTVLAKRPIA